MTVTPLRPGAPPRPLPSNTDVEQQLLGTIFCDNAAYRMVSAFLRPEHFDSAVHARIYEAIGKLAESGRPANPVTLKNLFERDSGLIEVGGARYLVHLATSAVTTLNSYDYGRRLVDLAQRRALIRVALDVIEDAHDFTPDDDAAAQIERAKEQLSKIRSVADADREFDLALLSAANGWSEKCRSRCSCSGRSSAQRAGF